MGKKTLASLLAALCLFFAPFNSFSAGLKGFLAPGGARPSSLFFDTQAPAPSYLNAAAQPPLPDSLVRSFAGFPPAVFSDEDRIDALLIRAIDSSQSSIEIAMYGITLTAVVDALVRAKTRNVKVRIVIDESHVYQKDFPEIKRLIKEGFDVRTLRGSRDYGVMHNKIAVFDASLLMFGSYNWTNSATFQSCENVVFTGDKDRLGGYRKYWEWMWNFARPPAQGPAPQVPEGYFGTPPADPAPSVPFNGLNFPKYSFSPKGGIEYGILQALKACKKTADIVTYTFSSKPLADAIIAAHKSGIAVRLLIDTQMGKQSSLAKCCLESGVNIKFRSGKGSGAMHNKFGIFDGGLLETGSFNWTSNAELNSFENVMFINDSSLVNKYAQKYEYYFSTAHIPSASDFAETVQAAGLEYGVLESAAQETETD